MPTFSNTNDKTAITAISVKILFFLMKSITNINMHYGFHQKEQDLNSNGGNCSFIICIRKSRHNTPLK